MDSGVFEGVDEVDEEVLLGVDDLAEGEGVQNQVTQLLHQHLPLVQILLELVHHQPLQ